MGGGGEVEDGGGQVHKGPNWRCKKAQVVRRPKLLSALSALCLLSSPLNGSAPRQLLGLPGKPNVRARTNLGVTCAWSMHMFRTRPAAADLRDTPDDA